MTILASKGSSRLTVTKVEKTVFRPNDSARIYLAKRAAAKRRAAWIHLSPRLGFSSPPKPKVHMQFHLFYRAEANYPGGHSRGQGKISWPLLIFIAWSKNFNTPWAIQTYSTFGRAAVLMLLLKKFSYIWKNISVTICDNFLLDAQKLAVLILTKPGIIIEGKTNIEIRFHFYTPIPCPLVFFVLRSCYAKDSKNGQSLRYRTLFWIVQKFEIVFGIWFKKGWVTLFMHITICVM